MSQNTPVSPYYRTTTFHDDIQAKKDRKEVSQTLKNAAWLNGFEKNKAQSDDHEKRKKKARDIAKQFKPIDGANGADVEVEFAMPEAHTEGRSWESVLKLSKGREEELLSLKEVFNSHDTNTRSLLSFTLYIHARMRFSGSVMP